MFRLICAASLALSGACPAAASWLYQSEPCTGLEASAGFNAGGTEYFLLRLHIYHKAKGIAAFPDGGIPKNAFEGIYLFRLEKGGPVKAAELVVPEGFSSSSFKRSKIRAGNGGVLIKLPWKDRAFYSKKIESGRKETAERAAYYRFDPASGKAAAGADPGGDWPEGTRPLSETNRLFRDFSDFDAAGLPNPLDHTPGAGTPAGLARLIAEGLGERRLRLAAARRLAVSGNAALLGPAIAALDKTAASRRIYFWAEEKALLERLLEAAPAKKGD